MEDFPDEVIIEILSWLPVKSLLQFKCVSKRWQTSIDNPDFIKLHLNRSIQEDSNFSLIIKKDQDLFHLHHPENLESSTKIEVEYSFVFKLAKPVSSCNGIVCLSHETTIFLFNPSTKELTRLPEPPTFRYHGYDDCSPIIHLGFGYTSITQEYKVVRCVYLNALDVFDVYPCTSPSQVKEIMVHTVGTDSWRTVEDIRDDISIKDPGVLLNGALHWLNSYKSSVVVSLDVATEKSEYMNMPMFEGDGVSFLGALRGLLCVCSRRPSASGMEIWVMNHYGVEESWVHQFTIEMASFEYFRPLRWLETGVLIKKHDGGLFIYYPRIVSIRRVPNLGGAVVFGESLVSLKSQVGVEN